MASSTPRIDVIESNAAIANSLANAAGVTTLVSPPKIDVPYTVITNRAKIPDLSQDCSVKFGIDRITIQQAALMQDEFGPNGEPIYGVVNDDLGLIRIGGLVGQHHTSGVDTNSGAAVYVSGVGSFLEVTFYGTGLNILGFSLSISREASITVDGIPYGTYVENTLSSTGVLVTRGYPVNVVRNVVSGLPLGIHTVRLTVTVGLFSVYGVEIIGGQSGLTVLPGSAYGTQKNTLTALSSSSYNSGFESGTLGTRGGQVLVYLKSDGTVGKAVTPTNAAAAYLTAASHTNEEVVRTYNLREFGASRPAGDDFSYGPLAYGAAAFTIDDGTTTLVGSSVKFENSIGGTVPFSGYSVYNAAGTSSLTITFVGTGLDIFCGTENISKTISNIYVDGVNVGTLGALPAVNQLYQKRIASGLPYGTHTVKLENTSTALTSVGIHSFLVYGPKKPTLPSGAVELADYNIMADFAANTVAGVETIATGVLRKSPARELTYVNGTGGTSSWSIASYAGAVPAGWQTGTDRLNAYVEYTFFGTGCEVRFNTQSNRSANISVSFQNLSAGGSLLAATTANFPTLVSSAYGTGAAFSAGVLDQLDAVGQLGSGVRLSGLPLSVWKIRLNNNTAGALIVVDAIDVITPIHSNKNISSGLQSSVTVGSQGITDLKKYNTSLLEKPKSWAQFFPIVLGAPIASSTTSTSAVPVPEATLVIKTNGNPIEVNFYSRIAFSGALAVDFSVYVDGAPAGISSSYFNSNDSAGNIMGIEPNVSLTGIIPVSAGVHTVSIYWLVSGGTVSTRYKARIFNVKEL